MSPGGARTPIQPESERMVNDIIAGNQTSMYAASTRDAFTPGYAGNDFTPMNQYASPAYQSPAQFASSPGYGSPLGASPIYNHSPVYTGSSPIYQAAPLSSANASG